MPEKHFARSYNATAYVTILSVTIFSRSGVGGGSASLDETGSAADRNTQLRFLSGSTPERAHGLNRAGFIEKRVHTVNDKPEAISYFGFITANREESLAQAKAALNATGKAKVSYVAADGICRGTMVQYSVRDLLLESKDGWSEPGELLKHAIHQFKNALPTKAQTIEAQSAKTTETFLYALINLIEAGESHAETEFIHNGRLFRLRTEQSLDESADREFLRDGRATAPGSVIRLKGAITANNSKQEATFRLWFDRSSANVLPLRFEFRPRSYLRLVFDAKQDLNSTSPLEKAPEAMPSLTIATSFRATNK